MKSYKGAVEEYLALRRGLGFKLRDAGRALLDFAAFLDLVEQAGEMSFGFENTDVFHDENLV